MPVRKKCLGIDLGSSSVKVAELAVEKGGVSVLNLAQKEVNIYPGTPDSERHQILAKAIKEILKEKKISSREAVFCISGQSVFVRQIKLPKTSPERLKRIIYYEAKQQIPFPLEKTIVEYQVFESSEKDEVNVLLVALKKEFIVDFMTLLTKIGLRPIGISVSTFAIYNFYSFEMRKEKAKEKAKAAKSKFPAINMKKLFKKGKGKADETSANAAAEDEIPEDIQFEEVKAYVNVGAATMDLAIARIGAKNLLGFTRSVPYAGNEITRSIQEKCELESFKDAEEMKKKEAVILSYGVEESLDSEINLEASEAATHVVDRVIADIRRSLDFYMAQPDGMAVDCIYLSGGQVKIPNFDNYIEDKLGLRVEIKNAYNNENLIFKEQRDDISQYVISIGLGLTGLGEGTISIDFLPQEIKTILEFKKKNILVFVNIVVIVVMIVVSMQIGDKVKIRYTQDIEYYEKQIGNLGPSKKEADTAIAKRKIINEAYQWLDWALGKRDFWFPVLIEIQSNKPSDMWIQELKMEGYGRVRITGYAERQESAATFTRNLQDIFKDDPNKPLVAEKQPELMDVREEKPRPELPNYFKFVIKMKLKGKKSRIQDETLDEDELKKRQQQGQNPAQYMQVPGGGAAVGRVGVGGLPPRLK